MIIKDNQNYLSNCFYKVFYMLYKEGNEKRRKGGNREKNKGREKEEDYNIGKTVAIFALLNI